MSEENDAYGLDEVARQELDLHLRSRSGLFLEAAIGSMLDCYTLEETATRLEMEARYLREYE